MLHPDLAAVPVRASLWRHRDFMLLWLGQSVSDLGAAITLLALPLVAVTVLEASILQVGLLTAAETAGWLLVALPAGAIVDRVPKRRLMLACDLGRALVVGSVPIAAGLGELTLGHLYLAAALLGLLTVFFEVCCQSYAPLLLSRDQFVEGNSRIASTNALASVLGPIAAGGLVTLLGNAARVLAVDCLSYVVSVGSLLLIRTPETRAERAPVGAVLRRMPAEIGEGLRFVLRHPVLNRVVACTATDGLFTAMTGTLVVVFLVRELDAAPATVGLVLGIGSVGAVLGAVLAHPLARRLGTARLLWQGRLGLGGFALLVPLARPGWTVYLVSVGLSASAASVVIYNVVQIAYRQSVCPPDLLGRMNASVRWMIRGVLPLGGVLGGVLGTLIGIRTTLVVAALGSWLAVLWILCSPLRGQRDIPVSDHQPESGQVARR